MLIILSILAQATAAAPVCEKPQTQTDMTICATRDYQLADAMLNAQWEETAAIMRRDDASLAEAPDGHASYFDTLLEAQRAWLAFRDAHCTSEGFQARGGSMEPMIVAQCKADLTRQRIAQIAALANRPH